MSKKIITLVALILLWGGHVGFAQGSIGGSLHGNVTSEGVAVAGITVTLTSESLQGQRTLITGESGNYAVSGLPAGDYTAVFSLEGLEGQTRSVRISVGQDSRLDAEMSPTSLTETITVTGASDTVASASQAATTITRELVEDLPIERNISQTSLLTAGVTGSPLGSSDAPVITIGGAPSYQGLFMVNGAVVNENLRGQPLALFIEDAIEETTVTVSGVSAEYGRFSGGVLNTITKSGGNQVKGSLRTVFTNDDWTSETPKSNPRINKLNKRYEGTLGGYVLRDRLWYFLAARQLKTSLTQTLSTTNVRYNTGNEELRPEFKLTGALGERHRLVASYIGIDRDNNGNTFGDVIDLASVDNRKLPQSFGVLSYSGVFGSSFTAEARHSRRAFAFEGSGSDFTDLIKGTWIEDNVEGWRYNSPTFCGVCVAEERNNEDTVLTGTWFASTASGSHEVLFGADHFTDIRKSDNFQSGSNFSVFSTGTIIRDSLPFPVFTADGNTQIVYWPIALNSQGTDFNTDSVFARDLWRINDNWSVNAGARFDRNDGSNAQGVKVADDQRISPRLGVTFDPTGNGNWTFNASYGHYVSALANNLGDQTSAAGTPAIFAWFYGGPEVNTNPNAPLVTPAAALQTLFDWFASTGGAEGNTDDLFFVNIPGATSVIPEANRLSSPYAEEFSLGFSKQLGSRGMVRVDGISRRFTDFYSSRIDLTSGRTTSGTGATVDRAIIENIDDSAIIDRSYQGLLTTFRYRWDRLYVGGTYTLSRLEGNHVGETSNSGAVNSVVTQYPEYKEQRWNSPKGDLFGDQRHVARIWGVATLLDTDRHRLTMSFLQSHNSGFPYGAVGSVNPRSASGQFGKPNPGYASNSTPANVTYFYTARDAFHTDDITSSDLSFNYSMHLPMLGKSTEIFFQPEILNLFDEQGAVNVNTAVLDNQADSSMPRFNPFTETPVEGTHWRKGSLFGQPVRESDYQAPRTYRFSVGFRF